MLDIPEHAYAYRPLKCAYNPDMDRIAAACRRLRAGPSRYTSTEMDFEPGTRQQYCSANYILLGLLLANHYHKDGDSWSWKVRACANKH